MKRKIGHIIIIAFLAIPAIPLQAQDSAHVLKNVTVKGVKKKNTFTNITPAQSLNRESLQQINAPTVGDAVRFFSGVQVKDYGGAGGLKTISVRGLGAFQTGVLYDEIPVSDVQTGQTDLSRYSSNALQFIDLYQPNPPAIMQPARAFASASILSMYSPAFNPELNKQNSWQAGLRAGSFGYWQGFGGASFALPKQTFLSVFAEGVTSRGDYPFTLPNGNISKKTKRNNSQLRSIQGEINFAKKFNDSSTLQIKGFTYNSKRGLPGAIIYYNDRATHQLYNQDYFAQARYNNQFSTGTSLLVSGKFNHTYTRYVNPEVLNNTGGLNDEYKQTEGYLSAAAKQEIGHYFSASLSADAAYTTLGANKAQFVNPKRFSAWSNGLLAYTDTLWKIQASVLWSHFNDKTDTSKTNQVRDKFTPTISLSRKITAHSPFTVRVFYKEVYRMPTFDDLYYNFIGNANLRPELAKQWNVGVTHSHGFVNSFVKQFNISVDGYINRIKDKIIAVPGQNLFSWTMLNVGKVDIKGIDLTTEINGHIAHTVDWTTRVAYTYQQAKDITDPTSSKYNNRIPYSPDNSGSGMASFSYKTWSLGYSIVFSGVRYALGENSADNQLDGWGTQDLFASKHFSINKIKCAVKAEANNITNQQYEVIKYYPMPGRSYKISLTINK